ncbi:intermembrane phospholipid transport protein YdbH family protein [Novosphingobium humi]|uniref:YdbH domain-containing protein n=1 Tax=Novosphingobium humi TaxID=2282397 RepID=A0ABY7U0G0_9SPHN|nr:YdbH domain-containing protein [Novosphingobium humi]WCT79009.1 YdbH domain-containing protein [Novosphingobium humi]
MDDLPTDAEVTPPPRGRGLFQAPRGRGRQLALAGAGLVALALGLGWAERLSIADAVLRRELVRLGLAARFNVAELDTRHAVLTDVVVGDSAHPDAVIPRIEVWAGMVGFTPGISRVDLTSPRLFAAIRDGRVSFGAIDRLMKGGKPSGLPAMDLRIKDGVMALATPAGGVGVVLSGRGNLAGGFGGALAVSAPHLRGGGCLGGGRFAGRAGVKAGAPMIEGTANLMPASCGAIRLGASQIGVKGRLGELLDGGQVDLALRGGVLDMPGARIGAITGPLRLALRDSAVNAIGRIAAHDLAATGLAAREVGIEGRLRAPLTMARIDGDGTISGHGVVPDKASYAALDKARRGAAGTLAEPLIARIEASLRKETPRSRLEGRFNLHAGEGRFSFVAPLLRLVGDSGMPLVDGDRLTLVKNDGAKPSFTGSLRTAAPGLPRVLAEIPKNGGPIRLSMAEYRAENGAALALPRMEIVAKGGEIRWRGEAVASGALAPGVKVAGLHLPLDGTGGAQGARLWSSCTPITFAGLEAKGLSLSAGKLAACPITGPLLTLDRGGWRAGVRLAGLDLNGRMGDSPLRLNGGAMELRAGAGRDAALNAQNVSVQLGKPGEGTALKLASVTAQMGTGAAGDFKGLEGSLAAVPMLIRNGAGQWRYADGALALADVALEVSDVETPARFAPLSAHGAGLTMKDGVIRADAVLREPKSDRQIVQVAITHDLAGAKGFADLTVDGLTFDAKLQPDGLTALALGTIANAAGRFDGTGRIDWADGKVTSHGRITTQSFDFAGLAGPVKGVAGTVEFTDLLGLVTAPHQSLRIGSINPGIEATDGKMRFTMHPGYLLEIEDARWPFLDGEMEMLPTTLQLGGAAVRRFELKLSAVNAAKLITHMEVSNLAATGLFDGRIPLIFDQNGGRVSGGELISRPGGGSVSYVGQLSYRDLSAMANFAFRTLRDVRFKEMRIGLDGDLAGEVVTRVSMKGLSQGKGASKNFLTRQVAKLPLQFNVNIRAPFYQLIGSLRSLYDSNYIGDPRDKGLTLPSMRIMPTQNPLPKTATIQPSVSEHRP